MIKALLFDFDGLILDTETCDFEAWRAVFQSHGVDLPIEVWAAGFHGTGGALDSCAQLEARLGHPLLHRTIWHSHHIHEADCIARQPLRPGIADYLVAAARLKLKVAVVSSETRSWIVGHLARFQLESRFDAICCADDTQNLKPLPDLYRLALSRLSISPCEAIAFEDSPNGIRAAKGAGLFCVAVPNPITRLLDLSRADLIVNSLADLPLDSLLERTKGRAHAT